MYSFVIWDKKEKKIYLVRDIYGEKPLFFYHGFDYFVFGSELKVIKSFFNNSLEINQESVHLYSCLGYIPAPYSIYKNVYKVLPGEIIEIKNNKDLKKKKKYYNFPKYNTNFISSKQNLLERTHQLIEEAVKKMMTADVEIGCFLSGGIDLSLIASLMKKNSNNQIKTFSIGFKEKQYDESIYSKEIANFLKTDHHELIISNDDLLNNIEKVASIYDEPFGDSSFLPTFLLSKFASEHVKVVLSGDGGDETFLGYNRYYYAQKLLNFQKIMPYYLRLFLSNLLKGVPNGLYDYLSYPFLKFFGIHGFSSKVNKISSLMNFTDHKDFYKKLNIVDNSMLDFLTDFNIFENMQNIVKSTQMNDVNFYLSNDILVKVDRASMANSLEVRAPFLDRNLANNVFRLPVKLLLKNNQLKSILKKGYKNFYQKNYLIDQKWVLQFHLINGSRIKILDRSSTKYFLKLIGKKLAMKKIKYKSFGRITIIFLVIHQL